MIGRRKKVRTGVDKSGLPFSYKPPPGKRERNAERTVALRGARLKIQRRSHGRCEFLCILAGEPTEAHHALSGSSRRELESEYSMAWVCEDCHKRTEAEPLWDLDQSLAWARRQAAASAKRGDYLGAEAFTFTAERLEGKLALAAAQAVTPTGRRSA